MWNPWLLKLTASYPNTHVVESSESPLSRPRIEPHIDLCHFLNQRASIQQSFTQLHVMVPVTNADGTTVSGGNGSARCKGIAGIPCPDKTPGGSIVRSTWSCICTPEQHVCVHCFLWHVLTPEAKQHVISRQSAPVMVCSLTVSHSISDYLHLV